MTKFSLISILCSSLLLSACGTLSENIQDENIIRSAVGTHPYYLTLPKNLSNKKVPLLLIMHAKGVSVENYFNQWREEKALNREVIGLFLGWEVNKGKQIGLSRIYDFLDEIQKSYPVDPKRVYVAGVSAGGLYAKLLIDRKPEYWTGGVFMAYIPTLGWFEKVNVQTYPDLFFIMGEEDAQFQAISLPSKVEILKSRGMKIKYQIQPGVGHAQAPGWAQEVMDWIGAEN